MSPKAIALFYGVVSRKIHFCLVIPYMIAHMYFEEIAVIALVYFKVYFYWSFHKTAILVHKVASDKTVIDDAFGFWIKILRNSDQSIKLPGSFETAGTNVTES